jgi:hypothetical protein
VSAGVIWNAGAPPKRGAYRVKSDGPSTNTGYRYWFGDHWGPLCQKRQHANAKNEARKVTLKRPVLWASPVPQTELPPLSRELYEFYPSMSAETHRHHVQEYARLALKGGAA